MSTQELYILNALSDAAERQRRTDARPAQWWLLVLPGECIAAVDAAARVWLQELEQAGVALPPPDVLAICMRPIENIAGRAGWARLH